MQNLHLTNCRDNVYKTFGNFFFLNWDFSVKLSAGVVNMKIYFSTSFSRCVPAVFPLCCLTLCIHVSWFQ